MKIENQVSNLEYSKRLAELGVKQDSIWYWWKDRQEAHKDLPPNFYLAMEEENPGDEKIASAFTVAELGLPADVKVFMDGDQYCCLYGDNLQEGHGEFDYTEANARTKMRIYLLENKLITL